MIYQLNSTICKMNHQSRMEQEMTLRKPRQTSKVPLSTTKSLKRGDLNEMKPHSKTWKLVRMTAMLMMCSGGWKDRLIRRNSTFQSIMILQKNSRKLMATWAPVATSSTRNGVVGSPGRAKIGKEQGMVALEIMDQGMIRMIHWKNKSEWATIPTQKAHRSRRTKTPHPWVSNVKSLVPPADTVMMKPKSPFPRRWTK